VIRGLGGVATMVAFLSLGCGPGSDGRGLAVDTAQAQGPVIPSPAAPATALETSRRTAIVQAVERLGPSVVSITVTSRQQVAGTPFDFFFVPRRMERTVQGWGTGFIVRSDGVILTNQHVVDGAETVVVTLPDGTEDSATVVGEDPTSDIAVLRIRRTGLPVAPIGSSADLMIGEWVVALGNPYAYLLGNAEPTVTAGVVSATHRNILPSGDRPGLYLDMIQTDAAINPGNSGGPLVNALGEVVGVNSSIFSKSGGSIGLGFAIPIERAIRVAEEILKSGSVRRAWVGLEVAGADAMRDWKSQGGVLVTNVAPGSPAAASGFGSNMILTEANGRRLRNYLDWEAVKLDLHVGDTLRLTSREGERERTRTLVTADLPTVTAQRVTVMKSLQLITVTPAIQSERGLQSTGGAMIVGLADDVSRATGLRVGDVVLRVGRADITSAKQLSGILDTLRPGQRFRVVLERDGRLLFTDLIFQ